MYSISKCAGKSPACGLSSDVMRFPPMRESLTPDYRSVGHLRFSLRGILFLDRDCRSGFGWDCSLARCLLLLLWMTSWTCDWCNKYCIAVFESESSWWSGFRLQVGCRSCFVSTDTKCRSCFVSTDTEFVFRHHVSIFQFIVCFVTM